MDEGVTAFCLLPSAFRPLLMSLSRWFPALLVMAIIFIASSFPKSDIVDFAAWDLVVKKGGHVMGYALLAIAYVRGLAYPQRPTARQLLGALVLVGLYGLTDEYHQSFVTGRVASVWDVVIDLGGGLLGLAFSLRFPRLTTDY